MEKASQMAYSVFHKFMHKKKGLVVKDSDVPLDILFNNEINRIKKDEKDVSIDIRLSILVEATPQTDHFYY